MTEELEKEADDYADKHAFRVPYDGSNKFYDDVDFKASKEGYLAGAKPREKRIEELEQKLEQTEKEKAELKEFFENEYFQISDRTADEKIKELEKHQVEVTVDDYSPYDSNTWGDMHEEWFVPKEEVRDLLKENYALITKAKKIIKNLKALYFSPVVTKDDVKRQDEILNEAEQFLKEIEK